MADKIIIDGVEYEQPDVFTIGEARILKRYTGLNLAQVENAEVSDPDFMAAVIHIAFARETPHASFDEIEARVNNVSLAQIGGSSDADPPTSAPSPATDADEQRSGEGGNATGEHSQETSSPNGSGMQDSATGAESPQTESPSSHPSSSTAALS